MRRTPLALAGLLALACGQPSAPPATRAPAAPAYELRTVVATRLAEFGATVAEPPAPAEIGAALREELEAILGPLHDDDARMRALVLADAAQLSDAAVAALIPVLGDAEQPALVRSGVAEILAARATPATLEALCAALERDPEPWLRAQCAYQLGRAGPDHVLPRLVLRLKYEKDFETAFWIADAVSRLRHLAGVEGMLAVWSGTSDETLRARAAQRLGELAFERGAADAGELVRGWYAGTLATPEPFVPSPRLLGEAWRWIERLGEWDLRRVDDARFALSRCEAWVVPLLAEALHDSDAYVRAHAAQCLERMGRRARGAADALVLALGEPRLAPAAAAALAALGEPSSADALELCLDQSPDPELRVAAALALGVLARPSSAAALRRAAAPTQALDLRQAASQALLAVEDAPDARAFLLECLLDPRADAGAAENALGLWLARRAESEPEAAAALARWRELDPAAGTLPDTDALRARRTARAAIVRALAP